MNHTHNFKIINIEFSKGGRRSVIKQCSCGSTKLEVTKTGVLL